MSNEPTIGTTTESVRTTRPPRSTSKSAPSPPKSETQKNESQNVHSDGPLQEEIRRAAYLRWIAAGRPECDGIEFWLAAESELAQTAPASKKNPT